jgi:hypothetical protein
MIPASISFKVIPYNKTSKACGMDYLTLRARYNIGMAHNTNHKYLFLGMK